MGATRSSTQVQTPRHIVTARRTRLGAVVLAAGVLGIAGCSSASKTVSTSAAAASTATSSSSASSPAAATVLVGTTKLGAALTDANGHTLYTLDKDQTGTTTSACTGACATVWPALTTSGTPTPGAGVTGTLATIAATGGGSQVTWNGHPLYLFTGDKAAGDANGDGIGGFHVALASGATPATTTAPATTRPASTPSGGGVSY